MDFLYGGSGIDGLYGGSGRDYLNGGTDPDRFLLYTNDASIDVITDFNDPQDARLRFTNARTKTLNWSDGTQSVFNAGTWTDRDIERFDDAFGTMAEATGNNVLLRKSTGQSLELYRHGTVNNSAASLTFTAYNSGGATYYSNLSINVSDDALNQIVFHELGHNWDRGR